MDRTRTLALDPFLAPPGADLAVVDHRPTARIPATPTTGTARVGYTYNLATIAFLALAALDTFHPATFVTGSWWLVLLLVWLMPWPTPGFNPVRPFRMSRESIQQLTTLAVFAWLYLRANSALMEAAAYFEFSQLEGKPRALNFVAQHVVVGLVTASLFAKPLHRCFTRRAVAVAFVIAGPWFILTGTDTAFDFVRWLDRPLSNALWLFEATLPPLLLMQGCDLLERRALRSTTPASIDARSTIARLGPHFDRCPRWLASSTLQPFLVLTFVGIGLRIGLDNVDSLGPAFTILLTSIIPLCALLLTAATVHHLRQRRSAPPHRELWQRVTDRLNGAFAVLVLGLLWAWVFFVDGPLTEYYAKNALGAIPGPGWTIDYDADRQTLALAGEYQFGVAAAFADALDKYPDAHTVELEGPGGLQNEGLAIAYAIETRKLATHAVADCESACTLAFLAGHERILRRDVTLGFHAVSAPVFAFDLNAEYDRYLAGRGVDAEFIGRAAATPPDDMWYPTNDELKAAGVITAVR